MDCEYRLCDEFLKKMKENRTTMLTQLKDLKLKYRFCVSGKKACLTLVSLLLITLVHAQCPGCNTIFNRDIIYPSGTICDNDWGWDPWGAVRSVPKDLRFRENGNVYPNNDGAVIAGFDFGVANVATNCPLYNNKLFYYDPVTSFTRNFRIPAFPISKIANGSPSDKRYSLLGVIFTTSTEMNDPCTPQALTITPRATDNGVNTTVYEILYGHENAKTFCDEHYSRLSSFNYTVELPQWKSNTSDLQNICQNVNTAFNLANYFSVSGARFNLDHDGDTTWQYPGFPDYSEEYQLANGMYTITYPQIWVWDPGSPDGGYYTDDYSNPIFAYTYPDFPNYTRDYQLANNMYTSNARYVTQINPHDLSPGVHTILAIKTYDNGAYDGTFGSHRGDVQFPLTFTVLPDAPTVGTVSVTPSCPGAANGTITIAGVSGGDGNYRYILRNGVNNTNTCDPDKGSCFDVSSSKSFSGGNYTITGQKEGDYTLWIANNGGNTGACARTYPVSIGRLSVMDTLPITIQHISCPGGSNGLIQVTDTGGLAPYTFTLISGGNTWNNVTGEFNSLLSGIYTMSTSDGCGHTVQRTIELTAPLPVTITATSSATDCNNPANGAIDVNASGGSGTFDYYLYENNGNTVSQQLGSTSDNWRISALAAGHYTVSVKNTMTPGCTETTKAVDITGVPALSIKYITQTNNNCSYDAIGTLELSAGGGQENGYVFFLQNITTGDILQSNTGSFSNLPPGTYKAWVRNRDLSCLDLVELIAPIVIMAPPAFNVLATSTDITCNGKGDGMLEAGISGGTPAYNLQWQQWDEQAANWLGVSSRTGLSESNLQKGTYRLFVTDQKSCSGFSNTVDIAEPNTLLISTVMRTDIVCYNGTGSINMNATGGNSNYLYELSTDNGNSWNAFTAATALPAASYQLKVSDAKGCVTPYNQPVNITAPAAPLAINYALTDYNGFNVPCYGSTNGVVQLSTTGGNGSTYTGYTFAVDNGAFSASNPVSTGAGNHTFSVSDARGCIVTTAATLTQPAAQMQVSFSKRDNDCAGGQAGEVTVSTTGGTPQYTFSINGTTFQSSPIFSGLASANYQVISRDVNGCANSVGVTIVDLNTPITDQATISNVLCNNGSDGRITLSPGGGVSPYSYAWKNSAVTGNALSSLPTGNYSVIITDSKGCNFSENFTVAQPLQPLSATTAARPVCINNPFGNIVFFAQGGTSPYVYSINGGAGFSSNAQFNNIAAGSYPIKVADANGCTWTGTATVAVNGTNPTLNFLVSTSQNELDTLKVLEVCTPKPDSIHWTFDPQTVVIDNNMFSPLIRYNREGSYPVTMKAWFAGCDFTTSKVITIKPYDPNVVNNYNNLIGIDTVIVSPNPNNGNFNLKVKLYKNQRLLIKIYSVSGTVLWNKQWDYTSNVQEAVSLPSNIGNGLVFIKVLTENDVRDVEVLIAK
jgi:hypothetical protein